MRTAALTSVTLPLDTISLFDFDDTGNLTIVVKPDGQSDQLHVRHDLQSARMIRDERDIPLQYTYDAQGNPTSIVHADGSVRAVQRLTPPATSRESDQPP